MHGEKWKAEAGGEWWEASGRGGSRRQVGVKSCKEMIEGRQRTGGCLLGGKR